jgi:hypothetical protein
MRWYGDEPEYWYLVRVSWLARVLGACTCERGAGCAAHQPYLQRWLEYIERRLPEQT